MKAYLAMTLAFVTTTSAAAGLNVPDYFSPFDHQVIDAIYSVLGHDETKFFMERYDGGGDRTGITFPSGNGRELAHITCKLNSALDLVTNSSLNGDYVHITACLPAELPGDLAAAIKTGYRAYAAQGSSDPDAALSKLIQERTLPDGTRVTVIFLWGMVIRSPNGKYVMAVQILSDSFCRALATSPLCQDPIGTTAKIANQLDAVLSR